MDINEIRRLNLLLLIKNEFDGNKKRFSEEIDKTASYVSRWFSNGNQKRNVDTETARFIESKLELAPGWLDTLQDRIIGLSRTDFLKNQLLDMYEQLTVDGKVKLVQYANDLNNEEKGHAVSKGNPFGKQSVGGTIIDNVLEKKDKEKQ